MTKPLYSGYIVSDYKSQTTQFSAVWEYGVVKCRASTGVMYFYLLVPVGCPVFLWLGLDLCDQLTATQLLYAWDEEVQQAADLDLSCLCVKKNICTEHSHQKISNFYLWTNHIWVLHLIKSKPNILDGLKVIKRLV